MQQIKKVSVFLVIGLLIVATALFPGELGLNASWGKSRIAMLVFGILVLLIPWIPWRKSETRVKGLQSDLFALPALLIVLAAYLWFISLSHDATSNYYALLGDSFRKGELSLSLRPDPALLALENPYDPAARQGIKAPLDLSLYKGKFYLYWGAAPALLVAFVEPFFPGQISDGHLLLAFVCGIFLSQYLLIMHVRERFFPEIPKPIVILSIFVAGVISPTLWLLSQPKIYETAIAGGQFFFIAGLLSALTALDRPAPSGWRLGLAGLLWSLAVGTRSVSVFPIAFMTLMVVTWFYKHYQGAWLRLVTGLIPLGAPLLLGAAAFGWYNWARFGSISETGFTYALAGPYLQKHLNELFSPVYIFQNSYNYLLNPLTVQQSFPYLVAIRGRLKEILPWQVLPEIYSAQALSGLLWAAPFTVFAIIPAIVVAKRLFRKRQADQSNEDPEAVSLGWIMTGLLGSSSLAFTCLLAFFWAAMRYAEDFMPVLTLLSILGFWQGYRSLVRDPKKGKMFAILGVSLAGISVIAGVLLALSNLFTNGLL